MVDIQRLPIAEGAIVALVSAFNQFDARRRGKKELQSSRERNWGGEVRRPYCMTPGLGYYFYGGPY